jgi:pimeloyl-ACP methyl ester carboxylesterase
MSGSSAAGAEVRGRARIAAALTLVLLALLCALVPATARAALLGRCTTRPGDTTLCGRLIVPLDRTGHVPGGVSLRVRALPPQTGPATGTVLALAGGPGQAATPLLDDMAAALGPALRSRQLVTFDQRGTGGSGLLVCPSLAHDEALATMVGQCAADLGPGRIAYTTAESVQDVEALRAALGVQRLIVYGTSYGTKVALAYAAAYPQHVERLVLDSVVQPGGVDPFLRTTIASIPRVLRTLCAHACRFTHHPVADLATLVRRLARRPLHGTALDGHGHRRPVSVARADLLGMLIAGDLDPELRAAFPAAVHAALHGDPAPLLRMAASNGGDTFTPDDSDALFLATTCEDGGVPWPPGTPPQQRRAAEDAAFAALPARTFAPFDRASVRAVGTADLCRAWPESPIVQPQPPLPATPALILSGDDDLRTPRADAQALVRRLSGAQLVEVPSTGHSVIGSDPTNCSLRAVVAFLDGGVARGCAPQARPLPTLGLAPRSLARVHAVHGLSPRVGRTVAAAVLTLNDVSDQLVEQLVSGAPGPRAFGGLRAGSATVEPGRGFRLHGYAYVPGVTLTGLLGLRSSTLHVGGAAAAHGRLTFSARGVRGVLAGQRVHLSARALNRLTSGSAALAARAGAALRGPIPASRLPALRRWPGAR